MGLDMYLRRQSEEEKNLDNDEEIAYWRKANAIHNWFVKNVQGGVDDGGFYDVSKEKLIELREACRMVYEEFLDSPRRGVPEEVVEYAAEILPTQEGFFFGDTDYGEYYFECIGSTIEQLDAVIEEMEKYNINVYYWASW